MDEAKFKEMEQYVRDERDSRRPSIDLVVQVFDSIFERFKDEAPIVPVMRGPETWTWLDTTGNHLGFEKWYVLTTSLMAGTEGYPMVTIRQSIAPRLDSWMTFSQLVVGPDARAIEGSLATAITNHLGAFEGIRSSVAEMIVAAGGIPTPVGSIVTEKKDGGLN